MVYGCVVLLGAVSPMVISQKPSLQPVADGKRIFNQSCSACHDVMGTTTKSGPSLNGYYRRQAHPTDSSVRAIIHEGRGKMPAFSTLNKTQTDDLLAYLKAL
jgi:quinoprotein glucose dehydrogenase